MSPVQRCDQDEDPEWLRGFQCPVTPTEVLLQASSSSSSGDGRQQEGTGRALAVGSVSANGAEPAGTTERGHSDPHRDGARHVGPPPAQSTPSENVPKGPKGGRPASSGLVSALTSGAEPYTSPGGSRRPGLRSRTPNLLAGAIELSDDEQEVTERAASMTPVQHGGHHAQGSADGPNGAGRGGARVARQRGARAPVAVEDLSTPVQSPAPSREASKQRSLPPGQPPGSGSTGKRQRRGAQRAGLHASGNLPAGPHAGPADGVADVPSGGTAHEEQGRGDGGAGGSDLLAGVEAKVDVGGIPRAVVKGPGVLLAAPTVAVSVEAQGPMARGDEEEGEEQAVHGEGAEADCRIKARAASSMPLLLADKVHRTKMLVECDGDVLDLSGDMGAVGRFLIRPSGSAGGGTDAPTVLLDLKGVVYRASIVPTNTLMVVNVGLAEAKVEAVMSDFVMLHEEEGSALPTETMLEGTLEGYAADSDNDEAQPAAAHPQAKAGEDDDYVEANDGEEGAPGKRGPARASRGRGKGARPSKRPQAKVGAKAKGPGRKAKPARGKGSVKGKVGKAK